jgi:hypothetical protein
MREVVERGSDGEKGRSRREKGENRVGLKIQLSEGRGSTEAIFENSGQIQNVKVPPACRKCRNYWDCPTL